MTVLEFWGCTLITFGPALVMFIGTVADDPIKIIVLISSAFFWLLSFLLVAISWAIIKQFCDYLIIGANLAVICQEFFRFLFHMVTKKAQVFLMRLMNADNRNTNNRNDRQDSTDDRRISNDSNMSSSRTRQTGRINIDDNPTNRFNRDILPLSYVSGLGFGIINAAFSMMNVLTDYIGPGTIGLKGDSEHFLLVSSLLALAFLFLNVEWSIMMASSVEKGHKSLALIVVFSHLFATLMTFLNRVDYQLVSVLVIYLLTCACGYVTLKAADIDPRSLIRYFSRSPRQAD